MKAFRPHGRAIWLFVAGAWLSLASMVSLAAMSFDPGQRDDVAALIDELEAKGIERAWLVDAMQDAQFQQGVLDAMAGAVERRLRWDEYREIFLQQERIERGVAFIEAHREAFDRVEAEYGVPAEVVAAIIGVETSYGRYTGRHRVLDSLSTLAFHHPSRGGFFRGELLAFLEITREQEVDPGSLKGSYAGAMGYPQFIPTSYRAYAVDFDGDGKRDLWDNPVDAIGSVGNYFAKHGWQTNAPIYGEAFGPDEPPGEVAFNQTRPPYETLLGLAKYGVRPKQEDDLEDGQRVIPLALDQEDGSYRYRLGYDNFYVITRYNHSHLYAMAVTELAEAILAEREDRA
ncbi:lytic murein transglycosylase B [Litchfieldella anticariensis]|nr:lytic murein transglycosylase B [Halomonas anticariensis]